MPSYTLFNQLLSDTAGQPQLVSERCLRLRLNTNQCQRCIENCPVGALRINGRNIDLDATQCTGCMSCVAACPQDALVSEHGLDDLLRSLQTGGDLVVSCVHQRQNHPDEITIPCVGLASKQVIVAIILSGCRSVTFNLAGCENCKNQDVSKRFKVDFVQMTNELSDSNPAKIILAEKTDQLINPSMNRRSYLRKIQSIVTDISKKAVLFKSETLLVTPPARRRIPFKTQLVKQMLSNLDGETQKKVIGLFCHTLSISEECNCCPLCKGICPTGAIKIVRSNHDKNLKFEMADCSGCGLCVEFCKKQALMFDS